MALVGRRVSIRLRRYWKSEPPSHWCERSTQSSGSYAITQPAVVTRSAHSRSSELDNDASNGCSRQTSARHDEAWLEMPQSRCARTWSASW